MHNFPLQFLADRHIKGATSSNKLRWTRAHLLILLLCDLLEVSLCASVAGSKVEHEGFCPNKLNANLWVDAQSTCERECNIDEVSSIVLLYE